MIEENIDNDATCFLDTDINVFRAEVINLEKEKVPTPILREFESCSKDGELWTMCFNCANSKEGLSAKVVLISLEKHPFRYSFTLSFTFTTNKAEY